MKYSFCFIGGQETITYTQKTFLFGIVGGKEIPVYKLDKMGKVEFLNDKYPREIFKTKKGKVAEYDKMPTYSTDIQYWKLFQAASSFGVQKRVFSLYFKLQEDPIIPISIINPVCNTDTFANSLLSLSNLGSVNIHAKHAFIGRVLFVNRSELSSILGPSALKWTKRAGIPSINLLKEMIYVDKKSVRRTGRMIRLMK